MTIVQRIRPGSTDPMDVIRLLEAAEAALQRDRAAAMCVIWEVNAWFALALELETPRFVQQFDQVAPVWDRVLQSAAEVCDRSRDWEYADDMRAWRDPAARAAEAA
ncbi:hypothetical protein [Auritidibacter sp. NML120636]|uniref:hypothetical protein n=1 Tax=Auritidibacter sp. NML120636 TaxID=2170743 RepID=UPI000D738DF3|nr:hypothetical protein [Auritidibacter sp. NML120636]PXA80652.1 hypothetical protein DCC25_05360 [Auritidibacter sp. NML120636]